MGDETGKSPLDSGLESNGDRVVGGSLRADGTVRKTVKIRPGFVPKDEVKRYDVRERRRQRQEELSKETKESKSGAKEPGSRPSRQFGGINNILQSNSKASQQKNAEPTSKEKTGVEELDKSLERLKLNESKDTTKASSTEQTTLSPNITIETPTSTSTSMSTSSSNPTQSKKKYTPPQRRKKYTLADLENS